MIKISMKHPKANFLIELAKNKGVKFEVTTTDYTSWLVLWLPNAEAMRKFNAWMKKH